MRRSSAAGGASSASSARRSSDDEPRRVGRRSPALEARLALLEKGGHSLAMVFRQAATQMRDRLAVEERAEVARRGDVLTMM